MAQTVMFMMMMMMMMMITLHAVDPPLHVLKVGEEQVFVFVFQTGNTKRPIVLASFETSGLRLLVDL
jgi:hypothetical protein